MTNSPVTQDNTHAVLGRGFRATFAAPERWGQVHWAQVFKTAQGAENWLASETAWVAQVGPVGSTPVIHAVCASLTGPSVHMPGGEERMVWVGGWKVTPPQA